MHLNYPAGNFHSQGGPAFLLTGWPKATGGELTIVLHPGAALGFKGAGAFAGRGRRAAGGLLKSPTGMVGRGCAPCWAPDPPNRLSPPTPFEQRLLYQLAKPHLRQGAEKISTSFTLYTSVWARSPVYTPSGRLNRRPISRGLKNARLWTAPAWPLARATGIAARKNALFGSLPGHESRPARFHVHLFGIRCGCPRAWGSPLKYFTPINIVGPVNMVQCPTRRPWNKLFFRGSGQGPLKSPRRWKTEMWNLAAATWIARAGATLG